MKIIILLDATNDKGEIVERNVRALEVEPNLLSLRQTGPNQTWLTSPHPDGNPEHVVQILAFPIGLKKDPEPETEATEAPAPSAKKTKKSKKRSK